MLSGGGCDGGRQVTCKDCALKVTAKILGGIIANIEPREVRHLPREASTRVEGGLSGRKELLTPLTKPATRADGETPGRG